MILEATVEETTMLRQMFAARDKAVREFDLVLYAFFAARGHVGGTFKSIPDATHVEVADPQPASP